jgi:DedD protein
MSLFSFFRKNKQEATSDEGEYYSRAEDDATTNRARGKRKSKQSDAPADPVLPEKKRARRRLIGAIALVLAAVVGLPMLLDSEPKPLAEDIAIQIPSRDNQVRRLSADERLKQSEQIIEPVDTPRAATPAQPSTGSGNKDNPGLTQARKATPELPRAQASASAMASREAKSPVKASIIEPKALAKLEQKPAHDDRDDARARAILEGKDQAKTGSAKASADKQSGKYLIQVAALANQEKINELRNKLKAAGIPSRTQKVATDHGMRTRIRVGPYAGKEEAEKMRAKLARLGFNGTLVPTSP